MSTLAKLWFLNAAIDLPLGIYGFLFAASLPIANLTNATLVAIKLLSSLLFGLGLVTFLCAPLSDALPCKRAMAILHLVHHSSFAWVLSTGPRVIVHSFGQHFEALGLYPERAWALVHVLGALTIMTWWQLSLPAVKAAAGHQAKKSK